MQSENPKQEERRKSPEIHEIKARLDEGDRRMAMLEQNLVANTEATKAIAENTAGLSEFVDFIGDLKAGTKILCRMALGVKFILEMIKKYSMAVMILATFIYFITHNFRLPGWFFTALKALGEM